METFQKLQELVNSMVPYADGLYNKNVAANAPLLRKQCMELAALCKTVRLEALEHSKQLKAAGAETRKRKNNTSDVSEPSSDQ